MTKKRIYIGIACALAMATLFYSCRGDEVPEIADIDTATMEATADALPQPVAPPPASAALAANDQATEAPVDVTMIIEGLMTELEVVHEEITGIKLERRSAAALRVRYEFRLWLNGLSESDRRLYSTIFTGERVTDPQARLRLEGLADEMEGIIFKVLSELEAKAK